ncbi:glycine betaine/L-proline transport ATP binding subunit [Achromobacter xylosoxidans]|nr:glycine betaine/L-proline transport ATP binding subunit [Achromobacter xylosoxidans]
MNRTKVLNATHAVNPARLTLTMRSRPAHSVDRMRALNYEYAPVLDGKRLAGVLTLEAAEQAVREGGRDVSRFVEDLASVPATAGLGEVLAQLVHSDQPVAVTGENDEFIGMLSRKKVVELVTPVLAESGARGRIQRIRPNRRPPPAATRPRPSCKASPSRRNGARPPDGRRRAIPPRRSGPRGGRLAPGASPDMMAGRQRSPVRHYSEYRNPSCQS